MGGCDGVGSVDWQSIACTSSAGGSKVLLRYKNHYYQLDLIPEPQAEAADAGWIGFRSYCKIGKKQVLSIAIWVGFFFKVPGIPGWVSRSFGGRRGTCE